jgi:type II secretory pathway component GspD/PulD (secretin)
VLGYLFGTRTRRSERTENLIFIVPTVIEAAEPAAAARIDEALRLYRGFEGASDGTLFELASPRRRGRARR